MGSFFPLHGHPTPANILTLRRIADEGMQARVEETHYTRRSTIAAGCRVPHPNVVLFDVRVGFHSRLKLGTFTDGNSTYTWNGESPMKTADPASTKMAYVSLVGTGR